MAINSKMMAERFIWIFAILSLIAFHYQNTQALKARVEKAEHMASIKYFTQSQMQTETSYMKSTIDSQRKQIEDLQDPTGKHHALVPKRTAKRTMNLAPTQVEIPK